MPFSKKLKTQDRLEDDLRPVYEAWKAKPGPDTSANFLKAVEPILKRYATLHVGSSDPLTISRARQITLKALPTYNPQHGSLSTFLYSQLQGLRRAQRQQLQILRAPERLTQMSYQLSSLEKQLTEELGREPTDQELARQLGVSRRYLKRIRSYHPSVVESSTVDEEGATLPMWSWSKEDPHEAIRLEMVYEELDPYHQKVMEYALGLHGRKPLPNQEIARRLRRSPGAISQAKARIQQLINQKSQLDLLL